MSTQQWETLFGTMGWSGGAFRSGTYTDGTTEVLIGAGATDQMQYIIEGDLRSDDLLCRAYGGATHIARTGMRPGIDYRQHPRLYIYSGTVDNEEITGLDTKRIDLFLESVFSITAIQEPTPGGVTLASLLDYLEWFIKQREEMVVTLATGQVGLATLGLVQPHDTLSVIDEKTGRVFAYSQTIHFRYTVECDRLTGRIYNLAHPPV